MHWIIQSLTVFIFGISTTFAFAQDNIEADTPSKTGLYVAETHQDWQVRCIYVNEGSEPCQMYQLLTDANGTAVAEISVFPLPPGNQAVAGATFVAPLGTHLPEGVGMMIDEGTPRVYNFDHCNPNGCVARMGFTQAELDQLKAGNTANIRLISVSLPDPVIIPMSLAGFTASFAKSTILEN